MIDEFLYSLKSTLLPNLGLKSDNFLLLKHYNSFYFSPGDVKALEENSENINIYFHELDPSTIIGPYEPFLNAIADYCNSRPMDLDELFETCNVYSLHRPMFFSYFKNQHVKRTEDILLDEVTFEEQKLVDSIVNLLIYITQKKPLLFIINELQSAGPSTLFLLNKIVEHANNNSIGVLATYNESQHPLPQSITLWNKFFDHMVDGNHVMESGIMMSPSIYERITDFNFKIQDIDSYLTMINNLYMFLDYEHAIYYLEIIYKIINVEGVTIPEKQQFEFLEKYSLCAIYSQDMSKALLLSNNMRNLSIFDTDPQVLYTYNTLSTLTYMYNGRLDVAEDFANKALKYANDLEDRYLIYKAKMLLAMITMSGWHNIFFCSQDIPIDPSLLIDAEKYQQHNHLAHIYTYAFDNDPNSFSDETQVENKLFNVNKGIAYAKMLKNDYFLFEAYRNNIMIASTYGYYKTADYYYHKSFVLVKGKDIFSEATIYNGLGYNSTATEDFSKANEYYNKALRIFFDLDRTEYIGETFYNMALNCIMAHDFESAFEYLSLSLKIVQQLRLNSLRVCNISKLFGLLALCSFRLGKTYSCNVYINNTRQFLSHLFTRNMDSCTLFPHDYSSNSDDLFIYYYVNGLIFLQDENYKDALDSYQKAELMLENSLSNQFYTYASFCIEYASLLKRFDQKEKADKVLIDAINYYDKQDCYNKVSSLKAALDEKIYNFPEYHLPMEAITPKQVLLSLKHVAIVKENKEQKARLEFLSTWQKTIDLTGKTRNELIDTAVYTFINNFNLDRLLYIEYEDDTAEVLFNNTDISLSMGMHGALKEYFKKKRLGFVTSKINNNYNDYLDIITLFGDQNICSIVGIPFYKQEKMCGLLIVYILMKDNWHSPVNHYMLDESDFKIYDFVFRQLLTALETYEANEKIQKMNTKLKHISVTDHLTGLLNREGFYSNINSLLKTQNNNATPMSILYIDLDNFKFYNDTFGHNIGDLILKNMSEVFENACGNYGFVSRYGGDEFIILLNTNDKELIQSVAKNIYKQLTARNYFKKEIESTIKDKISIGEDSKITCSIGIAISNKITNEQEFNILLKKADNVLYDIKKADKGTFAFTK
jgi:diguanylate cyclase (GGDEF)-like protein